MARVTRLLAFSWGLGGVLFILGRALYGISSYVAGALSEMPWTGLQWAFAVVWLIFMAYTEGYRGFQTRFAPRVVARAWHLATNPRPMHLLLAPFFCIGFFHGNKRRLITSWAITLGVAVIVFGMQFVPQPWRGIVDLGVVVGLSWGVLAILGHFIHSLRNGGTDVDPQLP